MRSTRGDSKGSRVLFFVSLILGVFTVVSKGWPHKLKRLTWGCDDAKWQLPFAVCLGVVCLWSGASAAATCNAHESGTPAVAGFAAASNVFSEEQELVVSADCRDNEFAVTAGSSLLGNSQAVFRQGYYWAGTSWQLFTLSPVNGAEASGAYIMGQGTATIPYQGDTTYIVGYMCVRSGGTWKCGCRDEVCSEGYWSLQEVTRPASVDPDIATTAESGAAGATDCREGRSIERTWTPPALQNPSTIQISGSGHKSLNLDENTDYVLTCDGGTLNGNIWAHGGRNVVVRDCLIKMQCAPASEEPSSTMNAAVKLTGFRGEFVSFENLSIDAADCIADAVVVNKKTANSSKYDVYFFNSLILAGNGHPDGLHADIFQVQNQEADLHRNLYVEHVQGGSWYSGFTAFFADNTYVKNTSIVVNDRYGKTCTPKVAASTGAKSECPKPGLAPVVQAQKNGGVVHCLENAYLYGFIPTGDEQSIVGNCIKDPAPKVFTCLPGK